ncbi:hypothetical protein QK912_02885 [Lactococcus lactis]|uniref:hypothetical protein n=1 Tax=Lactococcus lactis TaxID=1358 RepID=UPI0021A7CC55|nr:hypothetical protein [Lactococcus lactis]MCT3125155.1 hypothetical protein [Lactococcus lactis]
MLHETNEERKTTVVSTNIGFNNLSEEFNLSQELSTELSKANFILLPEKKGTEFGNVFPEQTIKFYNYLKNKELDHQIIVDIATSDEDYQELELHSDVINICEILVRDILLPVAVNLISSYLYDLLKSRNKDKADMKVDIIINVEKDNSITKKVTFEGSIENFEKTMKALDIKNSSED